MHQPVAANQHDPLRSGASHGSGNVDSAGRFDPFDLMAHVQ